MLGTQDKDNRSESGGNERAPSKTKPRSEQSTKGARPLPLGTRTPKTISGNVLNHWVKTHAPSQAKGGSIVIKEDEKMVFGTIMQQVSLKQGLRLWGDRAKASAMKEMQHMHNLSVFIPRHAKTLTEQERKNELCIQSYS